MAEVKWDIQLSVTERNNVGSINPRQNNTNSEKVRAQILNKDGKPYDLTALAVYFVSDFRVDSILSNPIQKPTTVLNTKQGIIEYVFDDDAMQKTGIQTGYFEIYNFDKFLDATQIFSYNVQPSSRKVKANFTPYIDTWEAAEKMLNEGTAKVLNDKTERLELKKADKQYIEAKLEATMTLNPKKIQSLSELKKTYPNGDNAIYLSIEDSHWYYWDSAVKDWVDGGLYQTGSLSDFPATNIVLNGNFSNSTNFWLGVGGSISSNLSQGYYSITNLNQANRIEQNVDIAVPGHKYFVKGNIYPLFSKEAYFRIGDSADFTKIMTKPNTKNVVTDLITATTTARLRFYHYVGTEYKIGDIVKFENILAWDLTASFGAGNEPKTAQEAEMYLSRYTDLFFDGTKAPLISNKDISTDINLLNLRNGISNASQKMTVDKNGNINNITYTLSDKAIMTIDLKYEGTRLIETVEKDSKQTITTTLKYDNKGSFLSSENKVTKGGL